MDLVLDDEEVTELKMILDSVLSELSTEIADTDNASYRCVLRERRSRTQRIRSLLETASPAGADGSEAVRSG